MSQQVTMFAAKSEVLNLFPGMHTVEGKIFRFPSCSLSSYMLCGT